MIAGCINPVIVSTFQKTDKIQKVSALCVKVVWGSTIKNTAIPCTEGKQWVNAGSSVAVADQLRWAALQLPEVMLKLLLWSAGGKMSQPTHGIHFTRKKCSSQGFTIVKYSSYQLSVKSTSKPVFNIIQSVNIFCHVPHCLNVMVFPMCTIVK